MHFQHPAILLLLWILPAIAILLFIAQKRRLAAARCFVEQPMWVRLMPALGGNRPWVKATLLISGLALLIIAAARPQYGFYYEKVKPQRGVDCFFLLDVSRSMLAEDVVPNRLTRAKADIRDLLKKLAGDRVGLIVFAGKPVLKVPLTTDSGFFEMVLDEIDVRSSPRGGTLIGDAIRKALDSLPPGGDYDQILVLLTDGEDHDSYPLDAARKAAERGVKIFTVGLGDSEEGARIPVRDASGQLTYLKAEGREHWSKTDQNILRQIAELTGGAHVAAGTRAYDLGQIYEEHLQSLARGLGDKEINRRRYHEQYQVFLALGLLLLCIDFCLPGCTTNSVGNKRTKLAMTAGVSVFIWMISSGLSVQAAFNTAADKVEHGINAFRTGDFKTAAEVFGEAARLLPQEPRIAFDRGCAFAAAGEYDKAVEQFQIAAATKDRRLAALADYNLGCLAISRAKALLGEKPEEAKPENRLKALEMLEVAVTHFRNCLTIDAEHENARFNLEAIRLWKKHIQDVWRRRDAQKRRQEMSLPQYLQWLEEAQKELRTKTKSQPEDVTKEAISPKLREQLRDIEHAQRDLLDEIGPLKEKIEATLSQVPGAQSSEATATKKSAAAGKIDEKERSRMADLLIRLADEIKDSMSSASDEIAARKLANAVKFQSSAVETIDSAYMAVSPFFDLVKKGITLEESLISEAKNKPTGEKTDEKEEKNTADFDFSEAAWKQRFITNYGRVLAAKAKSELEHLSQFPLENARPQQSASSLETEKSSKKVDQTQDSKPEQAVQQQEAIKRALQAGVELAPQVVEHSSKAVERLEARQVDAALLAQEETLKLLRKMLPQEEKKQDQQNKNDKEQQDKNNKENEKNNNKDQQDQKKNDHEKQNQDRESRPDKKESDALKQEKPKDASVQQAEQLLRQVRQRQQDRREKERIFLEKFHRPDQVDKDW